MIEQEAINQARARIVEVIGHDVPLKPKGREFTACCPFHTEKSPSFFVNVERAFYHCFGCGAHGDAIAYVMRVRGLTFVEAIAEINRTPALSPARPAAPRARAREPEQDRQRVDEVLAGCVSVSERTSASLYLWSRGLDPRQPGLLAHPALYCWEARREFPALVAPITNSRDEISAVQRIWVLDRFEVGSGRPDSRAPLKARKKTLGVMGDGAVRLAPAGPVLGLAEGVETGIAAGQIDRGVPIWAACGVSRFGFPAHWREPGEEGRIFIPPARPERGSPAIWVEARPPAIWIPAAVEHVIVYSDPGDLAEVSAEWAAEFYRLQGKSAQVSGVAADAAAWYRVHGKIDQAPPAGDYNDALIAGPMAF